MDKLIIDISSNNGKINWAETKNNPVPIDGVILKVNEGNGLAYVDKNLLVNAKGANECGYPLGYYHFCTLNDPINYLQDAKNEAAFFLQSIKGLPKPRLPYALDLETNTGNLSSVKVLVWVTTFLDELEKGGIMDYDLYSYADFLNKNLPLGHSLANRTRLWLAGYTQAPILPSAWKTAYMWQYSSQGKITGIYGNVDCSKPI